MNASTARVIQARGNSRQFHELLQGIFVAECLCPSPCIWIVSPWISDIPMLDNRTGSLSYLEPSWGATRIPFSQVLAKLVQLGSTLHVATRPDVHNNTFLNRLKDLTARNRDTLVLHQVEELHEKGILGKNYYLSGSMNFTYNGIFVTEEVALYHTSSDIIAENRIRFTDRWGGPPQ